MWNATLKKWLELKWLGLQWSMMGQKQQYPKIPSPQVNYDHVVKNSKISAYRQHYVREAMLYEAPFIINQFQQLYGNAHDEPLRLLDYGCGMGRLAYAFHQIYGEDFSQFVYYGYEIHPQAIEFLQTAYADMENFWFYGDEVRPTDRYFETQLSINKKCQLSAEGIRLTAFENCMINVQYSMSVFAHMRRPAIINILREFARISLPGAIFINSWIIIDEISMASMRCRLANWYLPYEVDGFFTCDLSHPLVCAAYRINDVRQMYEEAGHEIVGIKYGNWCGRAGNSISSEDIVISRVH